LVNHSSSILSRCATVHPKVSQFFPCHKVF
jgi:hypothetical protein